MIAKQDDILLKAATGLEGGAAARGSTCGVVTGGALGLALMYDDEIKGKGVCAEQAVLSLVGEYVRWFGHNYKSSLCRERTGVNFYTLGGQARYLLPDKMAKCLTHIRGAVRNLNTIVSTHQLMPDGDSSPHAVHCARDVLKGIRERTGIGYPLLERASVVFDGGLGFQGQMCGALAGAIMGIGLLLGLDIRNMSYLQTLNIYFFGHLVLLRKKPVDKRDQITVGKNIVTRFIDNTGSLECRDITGKSFTGWDDFQWYIGTSEKCQDLMTLMVEEATRTIQKG